MIGSILVDPELMTTVSDKLVPDHFHVRMHSGIYAVMQKLFVGGEEVNIVTVEENCLRQGVFDSQDSARTYLAGLAEKSVELSSIESYANILDEKLLMRELILASRDIYEKASSGTEEPGSMLDYAEKRIYDIRNDKEIKGLVHIGPTIREALKRLAYLAEFPEEANKVFRRWINAFTG